MKKQMLQCDRCGTIIDHVHSDWGNCTLCGDDLCISCAGSFNEDGECERCVLKQKQEDLVLSRGVPNMHSLSLHDVTMVEIQDRVIDGSQGKFLIREYIFSGAGFRFTVNAFMKEVTV